MVTKKKQNILIIGSGGREHAIGWKLAQSPKVGKLFFAPGNPGTATIGTSTNIPALDFDSLIAFAKKNTIDLTVAGPDDILAAGIVNVFKEAGLKIFGPTREATQIESSKAFAKQLMQEENIPTATYQTFTDPKKAQQYIEKNTAPIVIKASGLALGKGVIIAQSKEEAKKTIDDIMVKKIFGKAGETVVIEEFLQGREVSIHAFSDGENISIFPTARDHKPIFEGNKGPNTGGMGTIAPLDDISGEQIETIKETIVLPIIRGLKKRGMPFVGCLYPGLMMTQDGPKVIEYNARFGDPETESYMRLLESDLYEILTSCINGTLDKQQISWKKDAACCIILASAGYPESSHKGDKISGLEKTSTDVVLFHLGTKEQDGDIVTNGGRVIGVTATGKTLDEALKKAYKTIGTNGIHFSGMQYRKDIGKKQSIMTTRIEIISTHSDTRALVRQKKVQSLLGKEITDCKIVDVYTVDKDFSKTHLQTIGAQLANPLTQNYVFANESEAIPSMRLPRSARNDDLKPFTYAIEIGFLPGVTDNIGATTKEMIQDLLKITFAENEAVYTSQVTYLTGKISKKEALEIAASLYNPIIQRMHLKSFAEVTKDQGMDIIVPKVKLTQKPTAPLVNLDVSDEELTLIGKSGIANPDSIGANSDGTRRGPLALSLAYMKTIQAHFKKLGRKPTDIELESIAQTWSEHCKHTIFADPIDEIKDGLYKSYIKKATKEIRKAKGKDDFCVSVFTDNSGAIAFDDEYLVTHKVETHNSPSALDPFGGAITGIVGVHRDAIGFGMGAKPVANFYGFCFADPRVDIPLYKDQKKTFKMLSSRRIMDGVIDGVNAGGNQSGIPTPQGFVYFDEGFRGKPSVFVGTVGLIPRKIKGKLSHTKKAQAGDLIVVIGGRVGKDGIHGATFSSEATTSGSPATAVQIGDPITQKKLSDAIVKEARDLLLYTSITDNGAGGISCSVAEMAKESGGCEVQLEKVPLKYPGLEPWEIWISESQERMTLSIPQKNWQAFSDLMNRRGVEATVIGTFTKSGKCIVTYNEKTIMDIDMDFLHDGLPQRPMITKPFEMNKKEVTSTEPKNHAKTLLDMLQRLNITSYEFISQQYDHIVQGNAVLGPLQGRGRVNGDTSVIRPVLSSKKGVILSQALYPSYSDIDPYAMAACAIDNAIRNVVSAGANPETIALLDNFCWCSSNDPERLGQLKEAAKACYDFAVAYGTPYISGKDSMFNDFKGFDKNGKPTAISIPPTLLISSMSVAEDITKVVSLDAKMPGDLVYILGETHEELGGSEYFAMKGSHENRVPQVDAEKNRKLYKTVHKAIKKNLVASSISIGRGGLATALAKKAIAGMLGLTISLKKLPGHTTRDDIALYAESQGRILVTIAKENKEAFEKLMQKTEYKHLGKVTKEPTLVIKGLHGNEIINLELKKVTDAYRKTFKDY